MRSGQNRIDTATLRKILARFGCKLLHTHGSHERWQCGQRFNTVAAARHGTPGVMRNIIKDLTPCLGEGWLGA